MILEVQEVIKNNFFNMNDNKQKLLKNKQLVVFEVDEEEYSVDITDLQEVINIPEITPVPNSPKFIKGILNLRGKIVVVIDLEKRFNLVRESEVVTEGNIIISEVNENSFGVIVDKVKEIVSVSEDEIQPAPTLTSSKINEEYLKGVVVIGEKENNSSDESRLIILLDLHKILKEEELLLAGEKIKKM